jgi:hypothetical protein
MVHYFFTLILNHSSYFDLQLAELKNVFDRFGIDDMMTAPEACQGLTECGIYAPRR